MQKVIKQILEGNFDYENGSLDFSCAKIELSIKKGQRYEGSFHIYATPGLFAGGTVFSSDWRMECLNSEFTGTDEEILFCFHGESLEEGDVVKGNFYIVSNQGEYRIPFEVSVEPTLLESSVGSIHNLSHFANLAKSNWREAVKLFYSPEFAGILSGSDAQYEDAYRALSVYSGWEQNVEEFLIQTNKKQSIEFLTEEEQLLIELTTYGTAGAVPEQELSIMRNGWGYTQLFVECTGDFLFTEKEVLTDDDFLGNVCRLPVFVDSSLCRKGRNYGQICLYNSYVTLTIPVTVRLGESSRRNNRELSQKRCTVQLMEFYQAYRMRKIGTATWLKESRKLVDELVAMDENDISARLFQAQLLITEKRNNEAGWILDHVADLIEKQRAEDTLVAYYLYLTTLIHEDAEYIRRVAADVEHIYRQDNANWRAAWLLLYLSDDYHRSATGKWVFLERQFKAGCSSPVLYIEALSLLNSNPSLLRKLGEFEQQVLYYGAKKEVLKQEIVEQMLYLAGKVRGYSEVLFKLMKKLYEKEQDGRLLQEICTLLIKGGKTGRGYFEWYKAGVDAKLRITNLYEYYMMSLDLGKQQEIPKIVLMYFSYQTNMDYARTAYLYDYILQNRDKLGDVYETYRYKMESFIVKQIQRGRINRHLADMYDKILKQEMVNEQTCESLSKLLFAHWICVQDSRLQRVFVYQPGNLKPAEYLLSEGGTWVSLYGDSYTIVFEDAWKNRFIKSVEYTIEPLMASEKYLEWLLPCEITNSQFDLYLCDRKRIQSEDIGENIGRALRIVDSDYADIRVKRDLYLRILKHYYKADDMQSLNEYLEAVPVQELTARERSLAVEYMVLCGNYELAGAWLEAYGPYFVDAKVVARFIGSLMQRGNMSGDAMMLAAAEYVFRNGKYDSTVLAYLNLYYRGMTEVMRDIWKAANSFGVDCHALSERILVQMLYSGVFVDEKMEIFRYYISRGAKPEVEEALLAQCSHDYFVRGQAVETLVFQEIQNMYQWGESVQKVCKLAFLKYCAGNRSEAELESTGIIEVFLGDLMSEEIHLEFFKEFKEFPALQQELADKTIIEYHTGSCTRACIHYAILGENGAKGEYKAEYMQEACSGVFFKEFVLFFGESLQYYITEETDGEARTVESGILQKSDVNNKNGSRYQMINDIVVSKNLQDFDAFDDLLEEYYKRDFLTNRLFVLR